MKNSKIKDLVNNKKFMLIFGMIFVIAVLSIVGYFTVLFDQGNETKQPTQNTQTVTEQPTQGVNGDVVATEKPAPTDKPKKNKDNANKKPNKNTQDNKTPKPTKKPSDNQAMKPSPTKKPGSQPDTSYERVEIETVDKDLERKLIRAVGVPSERFKEDSLRILRALRFASVYGFEIEAETANAILEYKHLLKNVASERISVEINKLLCGENVYKILMDFFPVFEEIFPEFENANGFSQNSPYHIYDIWEHIAVATGAIKGEKICRLAMFFHDIGKLYTYSTDEKGIGHFYNHANVSENKAKDILKRLKYDNETTENVLKLIKYHDLVIENNEVQIKKLLSKLGEEQFFRLLEIKKADTLAQSKDLAYRLIIVDEISATANRVLEEAQCFSLKDLAVNGNDIMTLGYKGKRVGEILNLLLENVIANNLPNSKEKLIEYVKDLHI